MNKEATSDIAGDYKKVLQIKMSFKNPQKIRRKI